MSTLATLSSMFVGARRVPWLVLALAMASGGCGALSGQAIPATQLPPELRGQPRANQESIDLALLRQPPAKVYRIDSGDMLGIYIPTVLGSVEEPPPVHFPEGDSTLPPAIGYPIPVRDDGTIALPLVPPIHVSGLTIAEVQEAVRQEYSVKRNIVTPVRGEQAPIIVTLMRPRTYRVLVIRQDSSTEGTARDAETLARRKRGTGQLVELQAYQNDVLHALAATGGLPGLDAVNEVVVRRANPEPGQEPVTRIPLRLPPGDMPQLKLDDILLEDGDIVFIESRDREVFYSGGLLQGGEHLLPRDYDLDVLGAIALAGGSVGGQGAGVGFRIYNVPPSQAIVVRQLPGGATLPIKIQLAEALTDPRQRILIEPGDTVILKRNAFEEALQVVVTLIRFNAPLWN